LNSTIVIILIAIALLVLAVIAFLIIRRQRYVRALRGRGWTFESRPWSRFSTTTRRRSASASSAR
jgi:type II secretory pathway pseudopilin PulG